MNFIKKNLLLSIIALLIILGGGFAVANNYQKQTTTKTAVTEEKKTVATVEIIADGKTKHYDLTEGVGETALQVSKKATGDQVTMTGEGVNAFVTVINGRSADNAKKEFWELSINGKMSEVGAGTYIVKKDDNIIWKINTY